MAEQFEQLALDIDTASVSAVEDFDVTLIGRSAPAPESDFEVTLRTPVRAPRGISDPIEDEVNLRTPYTNTAETDPNTTPEVSGSVAKRFMGRVIGATYGASASWVSLISKPRSLSGKQKKLGIAAIAGLAGAAYLSHKTGVHAHQSNVLTENSFIKSSYNPDQLHHISGISSSGSAVSHFGSQINGQAVKGHVLSTASASHFGAEVNGKPVSPHTAHLAQSKSITSPLSHPKTTFGAEVNGNTVHGKSSSLINHARNTGHHSADATHATHASRHNTAAHHAKGHHVQHHKIRHEHVPMQGSVYTMKSGDNPWTISQRALGIPMHGHLSQHQLHQIWEYNEHLMRLNHIFGEDQAEHLSIGRKLFLPKA
jgi:hypothetical protein